MGYKIDRIHQVWYFEESSFDLFKTYIESILRYKQEAAGYPTGCDTPEEQQAYIDDYLQNQGISLRPDNIKVNPGLKKTTKIALNSFYGKWGQRSNLPSRKYVDSVGKFWYYLESDDYVVHNCRVISDDCMEIYHTKPDAFVLPARHTNVVIAAWTTSLAHLKLYDLLIEVGQRTLYYDTDSLIFTSDLDLDLEHENIPMGNYLGDLTDELSGDYISEFISAGSKNYGYKLANSNKTVVKCRGFTLNWAASHKINFDSMKALILGEGPQEIVIDENGIVRNMDTLTIHNRPMKKTYRKVFNKRILDTNYDSYPHGYIKPTV